MANYYAPFSEYARCREIDNLIAQGADLTELIQTGEVVSDEQLELIRCENPQLDRIMIVNHSNLYLTFRQGTVFHHYGGFSYINNGGPFRLKLQAFTINCGTNYLTRSGSVAIKCEGWRQKHCRRVGQLYHPLQVTSRLQSYIQNNAGTRELQTESVQRRDFAGLITTLVNQITRYEPEDAINHVYCYIPPFIKMDGTYPDPEKQYIETSLGEFTEC